MLKIFYVVCEVFIGYFLQFLRIEILVCSYCYCFQTQSNYCKINVRNTETL